ncbi:hypothetical protein Hanom_Chr11g01018641 [Helianthus anomalus]
MNIGVLVTQIFNKIQYFFNVQVMKMGEEGFKILIFKGRKIREFIGTLAIKDLVEIINLVQYRGRHPRHQ